MSYIVDHFGNGVAQVTDGKETIYLPQGRHVFNRPVEALEGHEVRIHTRNNAQAVAAPAVVLQDAPIEVARQGAVPEVQAVVAVGADEEATATASKKKGS